MIHAANDQTLPSLSRTVPTDDRASPIPSSEANQSPGVDWQSCDRFLAVLAHDLQTPLTAIILTAATEVRRSGDASPPACAARVLRCAQRMRGMVMDLLDFARARFAGTMPVRPEKVDLAGLARDAIREVEESHPGSRVRLEAKGEVQGEWDPARLAQVLVNLVCNAVQHGADGTPVHVRLAMEWDSARIEVVNRGQPISDSDMPQMFEPFFRGPLARGRNSVGLGLFIVSEIVAAHGGEVHAFNSPEAGTVTFAVRLPLRSAARE
jgi:signal transduction histidine kinase